MKVDTDLSLAKLMTFERTREFPVHRWFHYKEGYSPEIVDWALSREKACSMLVDPFCGVGTSLLAAKAAGVQSRGLDSSDLAVFVSRVKCDDYSLTDLEAAREFSAKVFSDRRRDSSLRWDFELFSPRAAFPKRNLVDIIFLRERIEQQEGRSRSLLLLALLSILPQVSVVVKDGGVLKIDRKKRAMPVKEAFRRKVKRMLSDLEQDAVSGPEPEVLLGDARDIGFGDESADIIVTSPPYLNNVDYSKVYGLELSLLSMSKGTAGDVRSRSVRSFIGRNMRVAEMPPEVGEIGEKIPVVGSYFADMEAMMKEAHRVLAPGRACYLVVANAVIHDHHVFVDEVLAEIGERLGFGADIVVGAERVADVRPQRLKVRESVVVLRK